MFSSGSHVGIKLSNYVRLVETSALAGVLFVAPLFLGGRHPVGRLVFVALVLLTVLCWLARQALAPEASWRRCRVAWLLIAGGALIGFQLIPLSPTWLERLSPAIAQYLPLWSTWTGTDVCLGEWNRLTLDPEATRAGLVMFVANAFLFLVVVQRLAEVSDVERMLKWVALTAIGMATLGLAQYLAGNGKFLWLYEHPYRHTNDAVKASFINPNHFAHFLALGVGPLIWWLYRAGKLERRRISESFATGARERDRAQLEWCAVAIAMGVVCFAALLSFSRAGVIVILVSSCTTVLIYVRKSLVGKRALVGLVFTGSLVVAALFVHGYEHLASELHSLRAESLDELKQSVGREKIWLADLAACQNFLHWGTGVGSHREVYRTYFPYVADVEFTHAESGYLQILLETGLIGLVLALIGIGICASWCFQCLRCTKSSATVACSAAISASLLVSAIHAVVDFAWYLPACMSVTAVLAACAYRLAQLARRKHCRSTMLSPLPTYAWTGIFVSIAVLSGLMLKASWGPAAAAADWNRYLVLSKYASIENPLVTSHDGLLDDHQVAKQIRLDAIRMAELLERVLAANPFDARANARMATVCLRRFESEQKYAENAMGLPAIRDAALASQFATREAMIQWLDRAVGPNRIYLNQARFYARRALQLCPLQGELYIYLAELSFLEGSSQNTKHRYIDQALNVRPFSGAVLFAAGREAALVGDVASALNYWKLAFHQGPEYQRGIIEALATQLPVSALLENFEPNLAELAQFYAYYRKIGQDDVAREVAPIYLAAMEKELKGLKFESAARAWQTAFEIHQFLGNPKRAVECMTNAVMVTPNHFVRRRELAFYLVRVAKYGDAVEQLQWCLRRQPDDSRLQQMMQLARRRSYTAMRGERR